MASAKDIEVKPIASRDAHAFVRRHHYSGKSVNNSQLHLGIFLNGRIVGAMQFGPPLDRSKLVGLVRGTPWNGFLELNRMALIDNTPRNTESRAIAVAMRLIRKHYPHVQWVVSFADATQCGDGTIYRASGFVLTGIKRNTQIWEAPGGAAKGRTSLTDNRSHEIQAEARRIAGRTTERRASLEGHSCKGEQAAAQRIVRATHTKASHVLETGGASMKVYKESGFKPLPGYQLRYVYFLVPSARERLTVPILPFEDIERRGAGMYLGQPVKRRKHSSDAAGFQPAEGGATPTPALQGTTGG